LARRLLDLGRIEHSVAAPVNWLIIPRHSTRATQALAATELPEPEPPRAAMPILDFFFAATWFVQGAMAAHLPGLLQAAGASSTAAIAAEEPQTFPFAEDRLVLIAPRDHVASHQRAIAFRDALAYEHVGLAAGNAL
jgi:hypothetical protein